MSMENSSEAGSSSGNQRANIEIQKKLVKDDESELHIHEATFERDILVHLTADDRNDLNAKGGLKINVQDIDWQGHPSLFEVTLMYMYKFMDGAVIRSGYQLTAGWQEHFVDRRGLVEKDEIALSWNTAENCLAFRLILDFYDSSYIKCLQESHCRAENPQLIVDNASSKHILEDLDKTKRVRLDRGEAIQIDVFDKDICRSFTLTWHKRGERIAATTGWGQFVQRRNLRLGNRIGLRWNRNKTALNFSVRHQPKPRQ